MFIVMQSISPFWFRLFLIALFVFPSAPAVPALADQAVAIQRPKLSVRLKRKLSQTKVRVKVSRKLLSKKLRVQVERRNLDSSDIFQKVHDQLLKKRRMTFREVLKKQGRYRYRVRLGVDHKFSEWRVSRAIRAKGIEVSSQQEPQQESPTPPQSNLQPCSFLERQKMLALLNKARAGLPELQTHGALEQAAMNQASSMAVKLDLTHQNWQQFIVDQGFKGSSIGQNIAFSYHQPEAVMNALLASEGHRNNILHAGYYLAGVGCVVQPDGRRWWVQNFGS